MRDRGKSRDKTPASYLRLTTAGRVLASSPSAVTDARHLPAVEEVVVRIAAVCRPSVVDAAMAEAARRTVVMAEHRTTLHPEIAGLESVYADICAGRF